MRLWDGDLVGQHQNADVAEHHAHDHETAQATQRAGGCAHQPYYLSIETFERLFVRALTRCPIHGVLERGAHGAVVFGRTDQEAIVGFEDGFQFGGVFGEGLLFEVFIENGERQIA